VKDRGDELSTADLAGQGAGSGGGGAAVADERAGRQDAGRTGEGRTVPAADPTTDRAAGTAGAGGPGDRGMPAGAGGSSGPQTDRGAAGAAGMPAATGGVGGPQTDRAAAGMAGGTGGLAGTRDDRADQVEGPAGNRAESAGAAGQRDAAASGGRDRLAGRGADGVPGAEAVGDMSGGPGPDSGAGPLLPAAESEGYRARWTDVQTGFVDAPRRAVEQADGLVAELMQHLAKTFADERNRLESQWDRGDDVPTDDLRTAFQRYRSFFERLLST
jgi:hypothetical protein